MSRIQILAVALATALGAASAFAQDAGSVAGVRMPAWVDRAGTTSAIKAGMRLQVGDRLRTGELARLMLRLDEGSDVLLGEKAEFTVDRAEREGNLFRGLFSVLKGAFRFTTSVVSANHSRDVEFKVAEITAGIRGTDLWGQAKDDKDLICLIEGAISVRHRNDPIIAMNDPLTFFVVPAGEPPKPVVPVDPEQLRKWAAQTKFDPEEDALVTDGRWVASLLQFPYDPGRAARAARELHNEGYPAEAEAVALDGAAVHRVIVPGFPSQDAAEAFAESMEGDFDISEPTVHQR